MARRVLVDAAVTPDLVVTSGLRRTTQTADVLIADCGWTEVATVATDDLNERHHGVLQGLTLPDAERQFGADAVRAWRRTDLSGPPSGETFGDVVARVRRCWSEVLAPALDRGSQVVVIGHGTSTRALLVAAGCLPPSTAARTEIRTAEPVEILRPHDGEGEAAARWVVLRSSA